MNSFAVFEKDNPEVAVFHLWNQDPTADTAVLLNRFPQRLAHRPLNPGVLDPSTIRPTPNCLEIAGDFQLLKYRPQRRA